MAWGLVGKAAGDTVFVGDHEIETLSIESEQMSGRIDFFEPMKSTT